MHRLRLAILAAEPALTETVKWNAPNSDPDPGLARPSRPTVRTQRAASSLKDGHVADPVTVGVDLAGVGHVGAVVGGVGDPVAVPVGVTEVRHIGARLGVAGVEVARGGFEGDLGAVLGQMKGPTPVGPFSVIGPARSIVCARQDQGHWLIPPGYIELTSWDLMTTAKQSWTT